MTPTAQWRLTTDELHTLTDHLGFDALSETLVGRSQHRTVDGRDAARGRATAAMTARKLIDGGVVEAELADALKVMVRPDRELAMRRVTPNGIARVSVLRRGASGVHIHRAGAQVYLRRLSSIDTVNAALDALADDIPTARPADVEPTGGPQLDVAETLSGTHDARALSDRIRAMGASPRGAMLLGAALATRQAFAEIVYYQLVEHDGRICRCPSAVGVFYTGRGRVVSVPSRSPAGELWTTLKAGSDIAVRQAVRQLVGLSDEKWEEQRIDHDT
jgi:hypothetical protein